MRIITGFLLLFTFLSIQAQEEEVTLDYYLPADISYNPEIPIPQEVIGAR